MGWLDDEPLIPSLEVPEHKPVETGLLDKRGQPIRRHPNKIGFHCPRGNKNASPASHA
jgi:hypothetical protein